MPFYVWSLAPGVQAEHLLGSTAAASLCCGGGGQGGQGLVPVHWSRSWSSSCEQSRSGGHMLGVRSLAQVQHLIDSSKHKSSPSQFLVLTYFIFSVEIFYFVNTEYFWHSLSKSESTSFNSSPHHLSQISIQILWKLKFWRITDLNSQGEREREL